MDMNPFAVSPNSPQAMTPQQPGQQAMAGVNNGTLPGGVAGMVKALMDGNAAFKARQAANPVAPNPTTTTGGPSVGAPMSLAPPTSMSPAMGATPPMSGIPGMPTGMDPSLQALFSPIPGQGG